MQQCGFQYKTMRNVVQLNTRSIWKYVANMPGISLHYPPHKKSTLPTSIGARARSIYTKDSLPHESLEFIWWEKIIAHVLQTLVFSLNSYLVIFLGKIFTEILHHSLLFLLQERKVRASYKLMYRKFKNSKILSAPNLNQRQHKNLVFRTIKSNRNLSKHNELTPSINTKSSQIASESNCH